MCFRYKYLEEAALRAGRTDGSGSLTSGWMHGMTPACLLTAALLGFGKYIGCNHGMKMVRLAILYCTF